MLTGVIAAAAAYLERILGPVTRFFNYLACAALCFMPIPVLIDVGMRATFGRSILGGIEIQEFIMVILVFFGVAAVC